MWLRMVEEFGEKDAAEFTIFTRGGVINRSCIVYHGGLTGDAGHNHGVPRRRLAKLAIEEQVAGLRLAEVAANEVSIALDQCFGVGKLGEGAVGCIGGLKAAGANAEEPSAQRSFRIPPGANFAGQRRDFDAGRKEPGVVVVLEGFAIGIAQEAGAVVDFRRDIGAGTDGLEVGDGGEPLAKGGLVCRVGEAEEVGVPSLKRSVQGRRAQDDSVL